MILLDTCVLIWLASDPSSLSAAAAKKLRDPGDRFFASAISAFEVGQKTRRKRLALSVPPDEWFAAMLERHQLQEVPITGRIAAKATLLPDLHNDPFDRLLVASALEHNLTLLTPDPLIRQYPGLHTLW